MTFARARSRGVVRAALIALGGAAAVLGLVTARNVYAGESALADAELAFDRGELQESIAAARRAASFAVPGAPHVDRAYRRLVVIAQGAEALGRRELARSAWQAVRGAALSTDSPWSPARPELGRANQSLARLAASGQGLDNATDERELARRLAEPAGASQGGLALLASGLVLATLGLALAAARGFTPAAGAVKRELWIGLVLSAIGVACWTIAVYRA